MQNAGAAADLRADSRTTQEFRRDQQLRTGVARVTRGSDDFRDVAGEVADGDIDLSKSDSCLHGRIDGQAKGLQRACK